MVRTEKRSEYITPLEYITRFSLIATSTFAKDVVVEVWREDLRPTPTTKLVKYIEAVFQKTLAEEDIIAISDSVAGDLLKVVFDDVYK